jgi:hypothetical protein
MFFLRKAWDWCVKHWKLLLVSVGGFIAFLIGYQRASRNTRRVKLELDLTNKDKDLLEENNEAFHNATIKQIKEYEVAKEDLHQKNIKSLADIELKKEEDKKDILNSDEKLDKILKDKWGLKKE